MRTIDFTTLKRACKYRQLSKDVYGGDLDLHYTCHHDVHAEHSWSGCDESSCPMLRTSQEDDNG